MTLFPIGTLLRLVRLARRGSRPAALCLVGFVAGLALVVVGAVLSGTVLLVVGVVLLAAGLAGSRPGTSGL